MVSLMSKFLKIIIIVSGIFLSQASFAHNLADSASIYIKENVTKKMCGEKLPCKSPLVAQFYKQHNYASVWLKKDYLSSQGKKMVGIINNSYLDGLDPRLYHINRINRLLDAIDNTDDEIILTRLLASLDMTLTDAFFLYTYNLHYGLLKSSDVFHYWKTGPRPVNLIDSLNDALDDDSLSETVKGLAPHYPGYAALKAKMNQYQNVAIHGGWDPIPDGDDSLQRGDKGERVELLQKRLLISGELSEIDHKGKFDKDLEKAVTLYQQNNGLYDDGVVDNDTLASLNVSVRKRIQQMELNLDKMRWLPSNLGDEYIMVNIPEYSLNVIKYEKPIMTMDVAVGGADHPSCVLTSRINYIVFHPYWNIPTGISNTELWPALKKEDNYLKRKQIQVLAKDKSGDYVVIDPSKINWDKISSRQFNSYRYRQAPNADNSLGQVKFMFDNPCQIYLHDTNESQVFEIYRRAFSHGCIRVGEPEKLATYILGEYNDWNEKKVAYAFKSDQSKTVSLTVPLNLYLVYFTSWVNNDDWAQFRNDIYNLDKFRKYPVYLPVKDTE